MKKSYIILFAIVAIGLVCALTCPDKRTHEKAVMEEIRSAVNKTVTEVTGDNAIANLVGNYLGSAVTDNVIEPFVKTQIIYKDYFFFSITEATIEGERKTLSIGVFGHVFTTFKDDTILKALKL